MMSRYIFIAAVVGCLLLPAMAQGQTIRVEAEWMTGFSDLGGNPITKVACSAASNDSAVDYIDVIGEWIRLSVTFPTEGKYDNRLQCAGLLDSVSTIRLTLFTEAKTVVDQTSDVQTLGTGISWSLVYAVFAGSGPFTVPAGTYTLKVELYGGSRTRLDYVEFEWSGFAGVEDQGPPSSWGRIKTLFR